MRWILPLMFLAGLATEARACTCFSVVRGEVVLVGRNYDWDFSDALVLVNKRGLEKPASTDPGVSTPSWRARWGSVTFNQYGRDFPSGGMNEQGLVVEVLWLRGTVFPPEDERLGLETVQWVQYQLDTAASVDEVVTSLAKVRIRGTVEIHFYVADRRGAAAAIEFLGGEAVVHRTRDSMPVAALANHTYRDSEAFLRTLEGWGGRSPMPRSQASLHRFARAASGARSLATGRGRLVPESVFRVLEDVAQEGATQWSVVYDPVRSRIDFRTLKSARVKTIDFKDLDFSCQTPVRMLDVDAEAPGDVKGRWQDYTAAANRELIGRTFAKTDFLAGIAPETLDVLAAYPNRARCGR